MRRRNVALDAPMTREQWQQMGRTAAALSPDASGMRWAPGEPDLIHVELRDEDAPAPWRGQVSQEGRYGSTEREIARFVFNDGDPYAELDPPAEPDEPIISQAEETTMDEALDSWVRDKWHTLLHTSGLSSRRL